ncbi:hypothetical protein HPB50_008446 [Hyalomma asiaticum]|uniref:Uncharacterized protein n=1 Tax=Hyalomma asiaticum TaxID=266040 RepID=A0ACB7TF33_HYAAI|nr:hypothetical protein HPB50_008446 [Hyalomma asiaticum]
MDINVEAGRSGGYARGPARREPRGLTKGRKPRDSEQSGKNVEGETLITTAEDHVIPTVESIRVLGLHLAANGHKGETIRKLA